MGSPRITSTKWPDSEAIARHWDSARSRVASPTSAPKTGTSGSGAGHDHRAQQVLGGDRDHGQRRQERRQDERRQVAGEVGLGGADPAGGQHGDLPRGALGTARRRAAARSSRRRRSVPTTAAARAAQHVDDPAGRRARAGERRPPRRTGPAQHAGLVERVGHGGHHQTGDRQRLGDHQHAAEGASGDHPGQLASVPAGAGGAPAGRWASRRRQPGRLLPGCGARRSACGRPSRSSPGRRAPAG